MRDIKRDGFIKILRSAGPFNLVLAAFFMGAIGQFFLYGQKNIIPGLVFFVAGILFFILADRASKKPPEKEILNKKLEAALLFVIIAVGAFFRIDMISNHIPKALTRATMKGEVLFKT